MNLSKFFILITLLSFSHSLSSAQEIKTLAGSGKQGYSGDGNSALDAQLNQPFGVTVGLDGDIYYCDTGNHVIRRISRKNGKIFTIAGTGKQGYSGDGGPPEKAELFEPYELRFHKSGDLFWVEMRNNIIRKIDAHSNTVQTVAGTGEKGFGGDAGPATKAKLNRPHSIQFDAANENLFVCDIGNHRIRKVNLASGKIETWCGNGEKAATESGAPVSPETPLNGPRALDRAPNGDLFLALREGNKVYRIDMKSKKLFHIAGTGKNGFQKAKQPALESKLSGPKGVAISPDGNFVYLADTESHSVRAIDLNSKMMSLIAGDGNKGDGPDSPNPLACQMDRLHGVGVDPVSGDLYIGDTNTHKVRVVSGLSGSSIRKSIGQYSTDDFDFNGRKCRVAKPDKARAGKPWIWRCRFYGAFPSVDEALLADGWHVAWIDVGNLFGAEKAMLAFDAFYPEMMRRYGVSPKPIMEGFSRGGLPAINWTIRHPDKVLGLYLDAAVLDIHTWPKRSSESLWKTCVKEYGLSEESAGEWKGPLSKLQILAKANIPIFITAGSADAVVPFAENSGILESKYRKMGASIQVILKTGCDHHPHSLHDPTPIANWAKALPERN